MRRRPSTTTWSRTTIRRASFRPPNSSQAPSSPADLDFRALPGIYVAIVMGRHAGFLTAASAAWRSTRDSGPHLIYVPERAFSVQRFIDDVRRTLDRHKRCIVAVSEGVTTEDGRRWSKAWCRQTARARRAWQHEALGQRSRHGLRACAARGPARQARPRRRAGLHAARLYRRDFSKSTSRKPSTPAPSPFEVAAEGGGSVALQSRTARRCWKVPLST